MPLPHLLLAVHKADLPFVRPEANRSPVCVVVSSVLVWPSTLLSTVRNAVSSVV